MNVALRLIVNVKKIFKVIFNTANYIYYSSNSIVVNALMVVYKDHVRHANFGDDLNYYLLKELTGKQISNYQNMLYRWLHIDISNFLCIGSIVEDLCNKNSIIWGSGAMFGGSYPLKSKPKKVLAVRGPLTREYLLSKGVDCPEVYGDPALLLPKIYHPIKMKKYRIGIIPHYADLTNEFVEELLRLDNGEVKLINMQNYDNWRDVVDVICECEYVVSSSLHGLIVSDAYSVPNVWVEFSDNVHGKGFKFRDYFASVERKTNIPIQVTSDMKVDDLFKYKTTWEPINIDLIKLINACPFSLNIL